MFSFSEAVSIVIECDDQAEVDRLWNALTADGGEPGPCGWLKDRFGLSWQVVPRRLNELHRTTPHPDRARRAMESMPKMGKIEVAELERAATGLTSTSGRGSSRRPASSAQAGAARLRAGLPSAVHE